MTLYVSNLMSNIQEEELFTSFAVFGDVTSCKIVRDKYTGVSRGFAFVDMHDDEGGNKAIAGLDKKEMSGRSISVAVAREKTARPNDDKRYY
jgi:RNA recognition motif-containing protein